MPVPNAPLLFPSDSGGAYSTTCTLRNINNALNKLTTGNEIVRHSSGPDREYEAQRYPSPCSCTDALPQLAHQSRHLTRKTNAGAPRGCGTLRSNPQTPCSARLQHPVQNRVAIIPEGSPKFCRPHHQIISTRSCSGTRSKLVIDACRILCRQDGEALRASLESLKAVKNSGCATSTRQTLVRANKHSNNRVHGGGAMASSFGQPYYRMLTGLSSNVLNGRGI
jgi:hypothetical protein